MILIATCRRKLLALEAADNPLDESLEADLRRMAERSEQELVALNESSPAPPERITH